MTTKISKKYWQSTFNFFSSHHQIECNEGQQVVKKPLMIQQYNMSMCGCDRMDQKLAYYGTHGRKTKKWYKKILTWIIELCQCNAHILYLLLQPPIRPDGSTPKPITLVNFKLSLIEKLMNSITIQPERPLIAVPGPKQGKRVSLPAHSRIVSDISKAHLIVRGEVPHQCALCSVLNKRKRSIYFCSSCHSYLCVDCFLPYHTVANLERLSVEL